MPRDRRVDRAAAVKIGREGSVNQVHEQEARSGRVEAPDNGSADSAAAPVIDVSVVAPTYREALNLPRLIPAVSAALQKAGLSHEIIIVDDDSRDGSVEAVESLAREYPVRIVVRVGERGLATAVVRGFEEARGEVLACMDADLSHPPEALPAMVRAILDERADFVIGSRYVKGGSTDAEWGLFRALNSRVATMLARPITSVKDPMSGYFCLRRSRFRGADAIDVVGYKIALELLVKTRAQRVLEVPIAFRDRELGMSKLSLKQQLLYIRHVGKLIRHKWFRKKT